MLQPRRLIGRLTRLARLAGALLVGVLALTLGASVWGVLRAPVEHPAVAPIVNDVSQLNPIAVGRVLAPTTTEEIVAAVRAHSGPISVGGARHSMGGQIATPGALHLDMRRFNRILEFSAARKEITVQTGTTWRQIQERIDSANLSVAIMQTYANFTVGGSLSVNVHGRYIGLGPLVLSVRSLTVVLADGSLVTASPTTRSDVFYGVIGGYGGLGVITEATLALVDNVRVQRRNRTMPVGEYKRFFFDSVRGSPGAEFHNADVYPDAYGTVNAVTYVRTDDSVTVTDRLIPEGKSYRLNRFVFWVISDWPFGKGIRQHVVDPLLFRGDQITWRNYEASYDVAELEPRSRARSTYVLQEYFVPVERFDEFVPQMREVLRRHRVNVINVSVRHANRDPGSLLAWARGEVFAFVLYYKQGTDAASRERVGGWTRELIDAALEVGGSYYLPYQVHASEQQFLRAYPRAAEFFDLKTRLDPTYKFRNALWDKYYDAWRDPAAADLTSAARERLAARPNYRRDEGQTFLTHPEWSIVYSSDEYAAYLQTRLPTGFPYIVSIGQYWANYREACALTRDTYPFNGAYHVMLAVIGVSYAAELTIKGLYENTIGRVTGWTTGNRPADEDRYAAGVAADYARFIHVRPWYEYRFMPRLVGLWRDLPFWGAYPIRKLERKLFLSLEYGVKAVYATLIQAATRGAYGAQEERIEMVATRWADSLAAGGDLTALARLDDAHTLVAIPRYDAFRDVLVRLARARTRLGITEIAGNDEIFVTGVAPVGWTYTGFNAMAGSALPLPTDATKQRVTLR
ncbi:MAG: FAD-binding oxidoreductase, partial [Gemmatimonadales bacterium]